MQRGMSTPPQKKKPGLHESGKTTLLTESSFIRKYIFPGGYLPSNTQLMNAVNKGSNGNLVFDSVENIGGHYTRTLRIWRENFLRTFHDRIAPALRREHPGMSEEDVKVFNRKWEVSALFLSPRKFLGIRMTDIN